MGKIKRSLRNAISADLVPPRPPFLDVAWDYSKTNYKHR